MKKILFLLAVFVVIFIALYLYKDQIFTTNLNTNKAISYTLNNKTYKLLVADNEAAWKKGLMNYRKLDKADGMIFIFPDKKYHTFWNKNTYMDLDIYWINDDKVVGQEILPSIEKSGEIVTVKSPEPVNKVVEIGR